MTHLPPPAEELRLVDAELWQLNARRNQLLARRAWLVAAVHAQHRPPAVPPGPGRPETSPPKVQNVLLLLGGVLLTVAAIAFTLVSWGHLGIAGRSLVLGTLTVGVLAAPVALLRRGLRSTAETVAGLGLALTVLDAYALHATALSGTDGTWYAAGAATLLAALWTAYGRGLGALRLPWPAALAAAQLPLPLGAVAAGAEPWAITAALLVTAGADAAVALRAPGRAVRITAAVGAYGVGGWGVLAATWLAWSAGSAAPAARGAALLALAAAIALAAAVRQPRAATATGTALASGLLLVAAAGSVPRVLLPAGWAVPVFLAFAVALTAAGRTGLGEPVRQGLVRAGAAVQAGALLWAVPVVVAALTGPLALVADPWSGAPSDVRGPLAEDVPWPPYGVQALVVLVAVAAALALTVRDGTWRTRARTGALWLLWAAAVTLPGVLELPYGIALSVLGAVTVVAALRPTPYPALASSVPTAALALGTRSATLTVLAALTVLWAVLSRRAAVRPVTAPAALAYATALTCAVGLAAGWSPAHTAPLVLVVPLAAALLAARLGRSPATVPVEVAGAVAGLVAIGLAVTDPAKLALVLGLLGTVAAGTAVRSDRRWAGWVAVVLFVLASWVRLAAWTVTLPEAYTVPVTVPALLVGLWRRRSAPRLSSWTAYGPGLAATLVPSLVMAWGGAGWRRPLLLGLAAMAITLLGAAYRLRAPLVLGGGVLVLDALHELAPYLVQLADALPRWVPPALAGLLLLALGATYERRLRDVRHVREALGRLD
ncbi:SCO7613 C-terminal domain-containing membrane protein [Streptomyces sp. NPDC091281]|uniref:SCO7613 C-terminal domain-containing membrane protein n=1 Tax=Streptomyces sp. NPDC091281 TaxID=3365985 RepID=UPI003816AEFA